METLADRIGAKGPLPPQLAVGWVIRLSKRIEQLHQLGVTHGRVSAEAIYTAGPSPSSEGQMAHIRDSPELAAYHSPDRRAGAGVSQADDAWAVGVVLYLTLTGALPFGASVMRKQEARAWSRQAPPLSDHDLSDPRLQAVVDAVLSPDRSARMTRVAELRAALEQWFPDEQDALFRRLDDAPSDQPGDAGDGPDVDEDDDAKTVLRDVSPADLLPDLGELPEPPKVGGPAPRAVRGPQAKSSTPISRANQRRAEPAIRRAADDRPPASTGTPTYELWAASRGPTTRRAPRRARKSEWLQTLGAAVIVVFAVVIVAWLVLWLGP